jgi:uncharacterized protein
MNEPLNSVTVVEITARWLESIVIGLNLCPFAKSPYKKGLVEFVVSAATHDDDLVADLCAQLERLAQATPAKIETILLIHPHCLQNFDDYNQFLDVADAALVASQLEGEIQIASFHPDYQFDGTEPTDAQNYSNRSPFPMLHLLREHSVSLAVESEQDADAIVARNITTLEELGAEQLWAMRMNAMKPN